MFPGKADGSAGREPTATVCVGKIMGNLGEKKKKVIYFNWESQHVVTAQCSTAVFQPFPITFPPPLWWDSQIICTLLPLFCLALLHQASKTPGVLQFCPQTAAAQMPLSPGGAQRSFLGTRRLQARLCCPNHALLLPMGCLPWAGGWELPPFLIPWLNVAVLLELQTNPKPMRSVEVGLRMASVPRCVAQDLPCASKSREGSVWVWVAGFLCFSSFLPRAVLLKLTSFAICSPRSCFWSI